MSDLSVEVLLNQWNPDFYGEADTSLQPFSKGECCCPSPATWLDLPCLLAVRTLYLTNVKFTLETQGHHCSYAENHSGNLLIVTVTNKLIDQPSCVLPGTPRNQTECRQCELLLAVIFLRGSQSFSEFQVRLYARELEVRYLILELSSSPKERNSLKENYYYYFVRLWISSGLLVQYLCTGY